MKQSQRVFKFGGSSVGSVDAIKQVIAILIAEQQKSSAQLLVVFSAFQGVTDELIQMAEKAAAGKLVYEERMKALKKRHEETAAELVDDEFVKETNEYLKLRFERLSHVLHGVYLVRELSPRSLDFIMCFGERLSAFIISRALLSAGLSNDYVDTRKLIVTEREFGNATVRFQKTNTRIKKYLSTHSNMQIITGFIAGTDKEETTTLGRGGSDYTATIFAAAIKAQEVQIWTDVDGVLTADPRKVKRKISISQLSYDEAMEMSHFGAKVIYPPTMQPALENNIPILIRNTFNPAFKGTLIGAQRPGGDTAISGISSIDNIALLRIQGSGMVGVTGIARRIFSALAENAINVILITQASSEHSICLAIMPQHKLQAKKVIEKELQFEIKAHAVSEVVVETDLAIVAVVGENMRRTRGLAGRVFSALGDRGINIVAIAQGSSELNISAVIAREDEVAALNALHRAFFNNIYREIHLYQVGTGLIGNELISQILQQQEVLHGRGLDFNWHGLANSRKMLIGNGPVKVANWRKALDESGERSDIKKFIARMVQADYPRSIFIDCTADDSVAEQYDIILKAGISIVTPNKKANTRSQSVYNTLFETVHSGKAGYRYETTVCAGLPVIATIQEMMLTGDRIHKIEGIFSGTLSYIFNEFTGDNKFSDVVRQAQESGFTEPDPREDLNGNDVARKLLILAREIGIQSELNDVDVENLVPPKARSSKSVDDFFAVLKSEDGSFEQKKNTAHGQNKTLRYIALLENGKASVKLQMVDSSHPFHEMSGSDNIIAIYSDRYANSPLVIRGAGAGAANTAAGVFADIIKTAHSR